MIQAPPNDINKVISAMVATTQDERVSIEDEGDCNIEGTRRRVLQAAPHLATRDREDLPCCCIAPKCAKYRLAEISFYLHAPANEMPALVPIFCGFASARPSLYEWATGPR